MTMNMSLEAAGESSVIERERGGRGKEGERGGEGRGRKRERDAVSPSYLEIFNVQCHVTD